MNPAVTESPACVAQISAGQVLFCLPYSLVAGDSGTVRQTPNPERPEGAVPLFPSAHPQLRPIITAMYVAKFGAPGPNTKIFVRAKNVVNGQAGVASAWKAIVPAA